MKQVMRTELWDYTCFHCRGRGSPDQDTTGNGHSKDCPAYGKKIRSELERRCYLKGDGF